MSGGIAVRDHLLCWAATDARGRVLLLDLDDQSLVAQWDYRSDAGTYADAAGVAFGADHAVLVADPRNARVLRFSPFGRRIGQLGLAARPGGGVAERPGQLVRPHAVAWHDGLTYVACGEVRLDYGVQRFGPADEVLAPLRSHGVVGRRFGAPRALLVDEGGLWVTDTLEGGLQRFDHAGAFRHGFPTGTEAGEASRPIGLAAAGHGIWVLDAGDRPALARFAAGGRMLARDGIQAFGLEHPVAIAAAPAGRLLALDRDGDRLSCYEAEAKTPAWRVELAEFVHGG